MIRRLIGSGRPGGVSLHPAKLLTTICSVPAIATGFSGILQRVIGRDSSMEREPDFVREVAVIALGIFLGGLLLAAVARMYLGYQADRFLADVQAMADQLETDQREAQESRLRSLNDQEASRRKELVRRAQEARHVADQVKEESDSNRLKDEAWRRFYVPDAKCSDSTVQSDAVECGNAYMRARRQFEASWAKEHP